jgi:hypothetical protein
MRKSDYVGGRTSLSFSLRRRFHRESSFIVE